jgi:hypothetical protein
MQVIGALSFSPPPPFGGQGWRKGGIRYDPARHRFFLQNSKQPQTFSGNFGFCPEFFGIFKFQTRKNPAGEISVKKFLEFSTFNRKIFRFFKFRGQKKSGIYDTRFLATDSDLRLWLQSIAYLTTFFPTFAPTFFLFFNFQSKIFYDFQLSTGKFSGFSNFAAKKISRKKFQTVRAGTDRPENLLQSATSPS